RLQHLPAPPRPSAGACRDTAGPARFRARYTRNRCCCTPRRAGGFPPRRAAPKQWDQASWQPAWEPAPPLAMTAALPECPDYFAVLLPLSRRARRRGRSSLRAATPAELPRSFSWTSTPVQSVPYAFEQLARHRLLEVELRDFPKPANPEFPRIRIGDRLDVVPSPAPRVAAIFGHIVDSVVPEANHPVASSGECAPMSRDLGSRLYRRLRISVAHRSRDMCGQFRRHRRGHRLSQSEMVAPVARFVP